MIIGGDQVKEQATHDGQSKAHQCRIGRPVVSEPSLDSPWQHPGERLLTLDAAGVALEEEALERAQLRPAKVGPHGCDRRGRLGRQLGQQGSLAALDLLDDRQQKLVSRAEVVQEHAVAGADRRGDVAKRSVTDATRRALRHHRVEQLLATFEIRCSGHRRAAARFGP